MDRQYSNVNDELDEAAADNGAWGLQLREYLGPDEGGWWKQEAVQVRVECRVDPEDSRLNKLTRTDILA